ncbi:MAG: HAMP domain-containing histidine kinase [Rhodospirillaceae bacterium]|jgi:signal transduction histidine kinase|nr:HAMP domain-containing histidine kinase [Rhodospirillaceae bacterium]
MSRRLFIQVYLTFLAIVVLFCVLASLAWWLVRDDRPHPDLYRGLGTVLMEVLPPAGAPQRELDAALARLGKSLDSRLTIRDQDGRLLGHHGKPLALPPSDTRRGGWRKGHMIGPVFSFPLPDGRIVQLRPERPSTTGPALGFLAALALLAVAVALGAYPLARRVAGRLERLQARVEALGAGDLSTRIEIEGRDEIAALAKSFNEAAARIQALVEAQRNTLAAASHELRSPLARIRMAVELLVERNDPELRARIERDVAELDGLIEEILLASRLDTLEKPALRERLDLRDLVAEEAGRAGAEVSGDSAAVDGERHLLARMIRNLIENAGRHAPGGPIEVEVRAQDGRAILRVLDRGPGVPEEDRERIFEPFYRRPGMREGKDKGVGLGLALVRQIARRHDGTAVCRPRDGGGTCFEIVFPAAED